MSAAPNVNGWASKPYFVSQPIEHKVGGEMLKFYRVPIRLLADFQAIFTKPVGQALAVLFSDDANDAPWKESQVSAADSSVLTKDREFSAPSPEMVQLRVKMRQAAIGQIIDSITDKNTQNKLAEIILASLKEEFPLNARPSPEEFMQTVDGTTLVEMGVGVFKANKGMFGPLAEMVSGLGKRVESRLTEMIDQKIPKTSG